MINLSSIASSVIVFAATPSPEPTVYPEFEGDPNLVTPGVIGFLAILFVALATLLIVLDMNRRVRRVRYRTLAQETIRNEQIAADIAAGTAAGVETTSSADSDADSDSDFGSGPDAGVDDSPTPRAD